MMSTEERWDIPPSAAAGASGGAPRCDSGYHQSSFFLSSSDIKDQMKGCSLLNILHERLSGELQPASVQLSN